MFVQTQSFKIGSLVLALALAPAAHAGSVPVSRDTGVGLLIAAQGNQALLTIRAELKRAVHDLRPSLPAQVLPVSAPFTGGGAGGSVGVAPTQRCAK